MVIFWQRLCSSVTKYNVIPYNVGLTSVFSIELSTMNTAINPHSGTFKDTFKDVWTYLNNFNYMVLDMCELSSAYGWDINTEQAL